MPVRSHKRRETREDHVQATARLNGILTVTVTPFDKDARIDFDAYGRLIEFVIANGVHYVVPCGTTGEYFNLSVEERKTVLRFVAQNVKGRAKLFAGVNSAQPTEIVEVGRFAKELGYEGLMIASPYYSLPTTAELVEHFKWVDQQLGLPIMLYNFPGRTGVDMSPEFLRGIAGVKNIFAIKESSGSMARMHELLVEFSDRLEIVCGADDQAFEYFLWGIKSWVAGASNFLPAQHVGLYEACALNRDVETGRELMRAMLPMFMMMEQGGKYLQCVKYGCELAGVPAGAPRRPLLPLTAEEKKAFAALYERAASFNLRRAAAE
jgi:4-hydroxy-tetrahydrodipicolinate synthase